MGAPTKTATGAASSAAIPVYPGATDVGGFWLTVVFENAVATEVAHIRFGQSNVGPATVNDWPLFVGAREEFWIQTAEDGFYTVLGTAAAGAVYSFRSSH